MGQYPQQKFDRLGPNAYQVCEQMIKPHTGEAARVLPFCSYSLQKNPEMGLRCLLFVSHAWAEGIFELNKVLGGKAWPPFCEGAYICFLANPQNLDISSLVSCPQASPFYKVLSCKPRAMLMAANSNLPIHSRLWCCLEAFCAIEFEVRVYIVGNPLWLVKREERERARIALADAADAIHLAKEAGADGVRGRLAVHDALLKLDVCFEAIAIKMEEADCFSMEDRKLILELVGDRSSDVDRMIKQQMVDKARQSAAAQDREEDFGDIEDELNFSMHKTMRS